jgi:proteasome lid subunit RPN8/RPN11
MAKAKSKSDQCVVVIDSEVIRRIRQHARSHMKSEVCGILIGSKQLGAIHVEECIAGLNAAQAGTHVTFTQDTWEHVYKIKDRDFPQERIVGWYHSHPGFGVFLSDHDSFIHKNFFSSLDQIAWVYDPHSDEEGCFGWVGGEKLERVASIEISDRSGGVEIDPNPRPEPAIFDGEDEDQSGAARQPAPQPPEAVLGWMRWTTTILSHLSALCLGLVIAWYVFPRVVVLGVPIDPQTGRPMVEEAAPIKSQPNGLDDARKRPSRPPAEPKTNGKKEDDAQRQR